MNWKSRKFLLAVGGALVVILNEVMGWKIPEDTIWQMIIVLGSFIGIEGAADIVSRAKELPWDDEDDEE